MKIACYAALHDTCRSAQGVRRLVVALASLAHEVSLVRSEVDHLAAERPSVDIGLPVLLPRDPGTDTTAALEQFDLILYVVSSTEACCRYAVEHQKLVPGVVVFVEPLHGSPLLQAARTGEGFFDAATRKQDTEYSVIWSEVSYPDGAVWELAAIRPLGLVVASEADASIVRKVLGGPVFVAPELDMQADPPRTAADPWSRAAAEAISEFLQWVALVAPVIQAADNLGVLARAAAIPEREIASAVASAIEDLHHVGPRDPMGAGAIDIRAWSTG